MNMSSLVMGYVNIVKHKVNNRCGKSRWLGEDCVGHVLTLRQYKYYHHHILLYKMKSFLGHIQGVSVRFMHIYIPFQFEQ